MSYLYQEVNTGLENNFRFVENDIVIMKISLEDYAAMKASGIQVDYENVLLLNTMLNVQQIGRAHV